MSEKQAVLDAVNQLPDSASWDQVTDSLVKASAGRASAVEFARLYRERLTADDVAEYLDPKTEVSLEAMIAELRTRNSTRTVP